MMVTIDDNSGFVCILVSFLRGTLSLFKTDGIIIFVVCCHGEHFCCVLVTVMTIDLISVVLFCIPCSSERDTSCPFSKLFASWSVFMVSQLPW